MQNSNFSFQILDPKDETQCKMCQNGTLPDREHSKCMELPEKYLRLDSFWAIGAMTFALIGIIMTIGIFVVFIRYTQHYFLIYSFDTEAYLVKFKTPLYTKLTLMDCVIGNTNLLGSSSSGLGYDCFYMKSTDGATMYFN